MKRSFLSERLDERPAAPVRVALVSEHLSHYRLNVYRRLSESRRMTMVFYGNTAEMRGIRPIDPRQLPGVHHLKQFNIGRFRWQRGAVRLAFKKDIDSLIVLGDAGIISNWFLAAFARITGKKVLFWTTGWHSPDRGIKKLVRLSFYRLAHQLLLYGNVGREIGIEAKYPESRMTVIYNSNDSVPHESEDSADELDRLEQAFAGTELAVGAVIRLSKVKRLDLLVRAAAICHDGGFPVSVVIAGEGAERENLRALADELSVDLRLVGPIYSSEGLEYFYRGITATVVPAIVGLTAVQSLAHGVPVISDDDVASQAPEWEAIIPGVTGETYTSGSVDDLARVMMELLRKVRDEGIDMAAASREEVDTRWNAKSHAAAIETVVLRLSNN